MELEHIGGRRVMFGLIMKAVDSEQHLREHRTTHGVFKEQTMCPLWLQ